MYRPVFTLVVLLLALTAGRAGADQIFTFFDGQFTLPGPFYTLSIQDIASNTNGTSAEVPLASGPAKIEITVPDGTFLRLACVINQAPGLGAGWGFTFFKNGQPTLLSCSVENTASGRSCANDVNQVPVVSTDRVALEASATGTPTAPSGSCTVILR